MRRGVGKGESKCPMEVKVMPKIWRMRESRVHTTEKCHQSRRAEAPATEVIVAALSHRLFCFVL